VSATWRPSKASSTQNQSDVASLWSRSATPATPPASAGAATVRTEQITGTGGTFPAPVYAKWADTARSAIGVDVTYNAIGSGAGQDQIISRSVDFGAWL
jgi:ABC-type phosphate transport system substrate-binding protein